MQVYPPVTRSGGYLRRPKRRKRTRNGEVAHMTNPVYTQKILFVKLFLHFTSFFSFFVTVHFVNKLTLLFSFLKTFLHNLLHFLSFFAYPKRP
jgi:hypothetical protein